MPRRIGKLDIAPEKFDLQFWKDIARLVALLATVAFGILGGTSGLEDAEMSRLRATEKVASAEAEVDTSYEDYYELLRYHAAQDASCDTALESFSRHRSDERDWEHVIKCCHSKGGWE